MIFNIAPTDITHRAPARRKVAADDHELFMQQQTRNAEAYARKIKDVCLGVVLGVEIATNTQVYLVGNNI